MPEPIGLMDGGIFDNQGIDSVLTTLKRQSASECNLILISDVSSYLIHSPFRFQEIKPLSRLRAWSLGKLIDRWNSVTGSIQWILLGVLLLGLILFSLGIAGNAFLTGAGVTVLLFGLLLYLLFAWSMRNIREFSTEIKRTASNLIPSFYREKLSEFDFRDFTVGEIEPLVIDRMRSLKLMVADVFLKQIRRLQYKRIYPFDRNDDSEKRDRHDLWQHRRIANGIRELTPVGFANVDQEQPGFPKVLSGSYEKVISAPLRNICEVAASFGTTLWFREEELEKMLFQLMTSGRVTMCFNLLVYVGEIMAALEGEDKLRKELIKDLQDLFDRLSVDWRQFQSAAEEDLLKELEP